MLHDSCLGGRQDVPKLHDIISFLLLEVLCVWASLANLTLTLSRAEHDKVLWTK